MFFAILPTLQERRRHRHLLQPLLQPLHQPLHHHHLHRHRLHPRRLRLPVPICILFLLIGSHMYFGPAWKISMIRM